MKGIPFDLSLEDIHIPDYCPALGIKIELCSVGKPVDGSPSLDRIRPELGYVKGNVVVVSMLANTIKNKATPEEVYAVAIFYRELTSSNS